MYKAVEESTNIIESFRVHYTANIAVNIANYTNHQDNCTKKAKNLT
jgi:hypothetical protein